MMMRVRNRRYKKLLQLRQSGFFDQEAIKLRHPLLYHIFVGQYQYQDINQTQVNNNSQFSRESQSMFSKKSVQVSQSHINRNNHDRMELQQENQVSMSIKMQMKMQMQVQTQNQKQHKTYQSQTDCKSNRVISSKTEPRYDNEGLSSFLESHLVNMEYKQLLSEILSQEQEQLINKQTLQSENSIQKLKSIFSTHQCRLNSNGKRETVGNWRSYQDNIEMERGTELIRERFGRIQQNINNNIYAADHISSNRSQMVSNKKLSLQQRGIQEQNLIEYCEELFLEGKLGSSSNQQYRINYQQIDNNSDYDDLQQQNRDLQEKYFNGQSEAIHRNNNDHSQYQEKQKQQQLINQYYTGVQDY